ncbi:hypothetical protein [Pseudofrankia sp. BMG5.36]|uniref:hypothetical protein n=1 Tax=Pseudofrankia sp. BMG5.36 TaxID=1834512 RepID=UPI001A7E0FB0|nr:hypothetical protein [Pseudofrankia sp. BMG5.36]
MTLLVAPYIIPGNSSATIPLGDLARILMSTFIILVLTSIGYAVLNGESIPAGRAATEEGVLGTAFGVALVLIVYTIVLVFDEVEAANPGNDIGKAAKFARIILAVPMTWLVSIYICAGLGDYEHTRFGPDGAGWTFEIVALAALGLQLFFNIYIYFFWSPVPWSPGARAKALNLLAYISLGVVAAAALGVGVLGSLANSPCVTPPMVFEYVILFLNIGLMSTMTFYLVKSRR